MTCYTVIQLLKRFNMSLDGSQDIVTISERASKIGGTRAELTKGHQLTVKQLMFGMMLPSGNDAAFALAEHFGTLLQTMPQKHYKTKLFAGSKYVGHPVQWFERECNEYAQKLGLKNSHFDSPHGMFNAGNTSTAEDVAILLTEAMKNPVFAEVVAAETYDCKALNADDIYRWGNYNALLNDPKFPGLIGGKTGWTPAAGVCFAGFYERDGVKLTCVALKSDGWGYIWEEIEKMALWGKKQLI